MSTVALSLLAIFKEADGSFRTVKDLLEEKFIKPKHIAPGGKPLDFETKLTPLFPLTADLRDTDDNVKIMVAMVNRLLETKLENLSDFNQVQAIFTSDANLVLRKKDEIPREEIFSQSNTNYFDFTGEAAKLQAAKEIQAWLDGKLMPDPEFRRLIGIDDPSVIKGLVNFTGAQVKDLLSLLYSTQIENRPVLNLAIIQYPTREYPYFTLYKVNLDAWVERTTIGSVVNHTRIGLRGAFNAYIFEPRADGIGNLKNETKMSMVNVYNAFVKGLADAESKTN